MNNDKNTPPPASLKEVEDFYAFALNSALDAGKLLLEGFESEKRIEYKSSVVDLVTEYDRASEKLIVERLLSAYPEHGIIGEEGSHREGTSGYKWYVDPLDGTNNYAHHFPMFSVSISLYHQDFPLLGIVHDPLRGESFTAITGQGAFLSRDNERTRLYVSTNSDLTAGLLATGFPYDRQTSRNNNAAEVAAFLRKALDIRRTGSAALDMCYVAAGRLDGYWEYKLYAWDMAAARLIVEEAGGKFTKIDGSPLQMQERLAVIASNGLIHTQMVDVISTVDRVDTLA